MNNPLNKGQLIAVNTLISKLNIPKEDKAVMVQGFSGGRATSSKDLYMDEAAQMIKHLKTFDPHEEAAGKMRRKIISMAHEMRWYEPEIIYKPNGKAYRKVNMKSIDEWCKKYSSKHKSLDNHTYKELPALVTQFANGPYKSYLNRF